MERIVQLNSLFDFEAIVPVCASTGEHVDELVDEMKNLRLIHLTSSLMTLSPTSPKECLPQRLSEKRYSDLWTRKCHTALLCLLKNA